MINLIILTILCLTVYCIYSMLSKLKYQPNLILSLSDKIKLAVTGVIGFFADTIGLGSFAVNIALSKYFKTFKDEELPAMCNGVQVIPGTLESIFFIQVIKVDPVTLFTLVLGASIGGMIGGIFMSRLNPQKTRLAMICAFSSIVLLLLTQKMGLISAGGQLLALESWQLGFGFFAMICCGSLTSAGIGLFGLVQAVLFIMGVSPAVAFPIMTTAGAMQQPLTTLVFLKHNKIPLKKTLFLSVFGCIGVFIGLPIVSHLSTNWLHGLLLVIMLYNISTISLTYYRKKQSVAKVLEPGPA